MLRPIYAAPRTRELVSELRARMTPEERKANVTDEIVFGNAMIEVQRDPSGNIERASHVPFQVKP